MPNIRSLDLVLLGTSIFGVNQGCTGRFISPLVASIMGILNFCYTATLTCVICSGKYFYADENLSFNIALRVYYYVALLGILTIQIRHLSRRYKMAPLGREFYKLYQSSTWSGSIYGSIARVVLYLGWYIIFHCLPIYAENWDGKMGWRIVEILFGWSNFVLTVTTEFVGQAMLLFQHEYTVLCQITKDMVRERVYEMRKLRALNRRHASLFALSDRVARFTGIDSLLIVESERLVILIAIFIHINYNMTNSSHWGKQLLDLGSYGYRIERITHHCFRGHRIITEANRFAATLDEIDPLDLENEEMFTELQVIRKQVKLRRLQFDCNRFLKLDMKLIFHISRDLLTMILILVQLTTQSHIGKSQPANATTADNATYLVSSLLEPAVSRVNLSRGIIPQIVGEDDHF